MIFLISTDISFNFDMKRKNKNVYALHKGKKEKKQKKRYTSTGVKPGPADSKSNLPNIETVNEIRYHGNW